ncbi:hypothetical protein [Hyphomicrobium sp.]|uniref:hypothetical protein n=1 Tax=Hyphomicrobium sp. TaxID=82 RepID=UPI0025C5427E|nr:hypothetical protein [Hyphomicrobium sp.]
MTGTSAIRPRWAAPAAWSAILFGVATILVGGKTLIADPASADDIVPFVLWFNFIAGFAYVTAGYGILVWKRWAAWLSAVIAAATLAAFVAFGIHVAVGGSFAARTVGAMMLRSLVWTVIAVATCRALGCVPREAAHPSRLG